ncbi:5'-3' exonuclease H3TH domain-containing protein [Salinisphaera sp. Q1T1-3]|uniref:5'-3' exonuclease n=1 Tax=Salinisphaera sp. Q1T1-3 TaxID=2321229 RepID=UPI000E7584C3|nr:5'-3' exonuclease H3TH domain-containing protein [Salinisphaera sp. Q1T1-3]RJS92883.1 exodeoxyribonuclease IX [Salinisphaera sp. Q1T1-3]
MLLIDASVYIFRAFHALPASIAGADGRPLNAFHGYAGFLLGLLDATDESRVAAAFDESLTSSFRNTFYADYKANRELPPVELTDQIAGCRELTEALGIATLSSPTYEADDLIGTLVQASDEPATIVTSDKDLAQVLRDHDVLWDYARETRYDRQGITTRFGVAPDQIPDYLALVGDTVDNIPGVAGIGAKTAARLLSRFDTLEAMLDDTASVGASDLRGAAGLADKLAAGADQARLSRRLATIVCDIDLSPAQRDIRRREVDSEAIEALCTRLGVGRNLRARLRDAGRGARHE